ncbi:hypothetical protein J6590_031818 [Homalodisca vitripennis]|nr:hypothetical protein J6590_031818 [Homalodisca vitripennis]
MTVSLLGAAGVVGEEIVTLSPHRRSYTGKLISLKLSGHNLIWPRAVGRLGAQVAAAFGPVRGAAHLTDDALAERGPSRCYLLMIRECWQIIRAKLRRCGIPNKEAFELTIHYSGAQAIVAKPLNVEELKLGMETLSTTN